MRVDCEKRIFWRRFLCGRVNRNMKTLLVTYETDRLDKVTAKMAFIFALLVHFPISFLELIISYQ